MSRFILRASAQIPHQVPTCLGYLPSALDHFIVGTRTSTANTDLPYSQGDSSPGSLRLFQISTDNIDIAQTIDIPVAVTALHVSPSKPTAVAVGSSDGSIRTFTAGGSPPRLTPSKTFTPFSEKAAITSIRFHPLHPGVLACTLYSGSVYVVRIPGHGLQGDEPKILWTLASHSPSPAWNLSWTPEPGSAPSEPAEVSSGIYSVGDDGNLLTSYWTLLEDVTDPNEMTTEDPIRFHSEGGVTGVAVIPSNSTPSRDVVITAGRDGKLKISNLLSFDLDEDRKTCVETSIGTGASYQLIGPKLVREHYIPSERDSLETFDPASLIPEGHESDDEDYISGTEDEQDYDPSTDPNYVDPDGGPGVPMDIPETEPLQNEYFVLAGEASSGLSMLKLERAFADDRGSETWTLDGVATFNGHQGGKLSAMDVYTVNGKINGASASAAMLDDEPSMAVCAWQFEP
ncbi:hypothetical protein VE01_02153 [Pseudogymnoascus verrucosus]|uniref:Uncharacterized protein n=1 Tax=Pseudogymnoascus verrucosus TaxID=342668 RepID=A0A1B8GVG2_9PEZI|nr:uncharacterized protein VE01_02153 [Pseudogymnoascus verrucosus]OBT99806.1 hypothetical protein VE01_02153 [Pseudogymnoascus verrucosus]